MSKSAQNKLLFLIAAFSSGPEEWTDVFSSPLPRIAGFPKRDKTIKKALHNLLTSGKLEYKKQKETILIRPTKKGFQLLAQKFPFYRNFISKWDSKFRLVLYDIPETKRKLRDALRWILKSLHFVQLQQSLWISPHNLSLELNNSLKKFKLEDSVTFLEAQLSYDELHKFVNSIWQVEKLVEGYKKLYKDIEKAVSKKQSRRARVEVFRKSFLSFQKIIADDPGLPQELLPKDWYGVKVRKMLKKLQQLL